MSDDTLKLIQQMRGEVREPGYDDSAVLLLALAADELERLLTGCVVECDADCDAGCHMGHVVYWKRPSGVNTSPSTTKLD